MLFKLAWRNIWRNKRRTLITAASVFTAVILALVMRSAQLGSYQHMIANVVSFYTGPIQIHKKGYWNEQTIDNSFIPGDSLYALIKKSPEITGYVPRFESFALASTEVSAKGVMVAGIEPAAENTVTRLKEKLVQGAYLSDSDKSVLLAQGLASQLNLRAGDTLVLLGQGYHGVTAAGLFPIKGIVKFPTTDLNQRMVYMSITQARQLYSAYNRVTTIVISVKPGDDAVTIAQRLRAHFKGMPFEVMDWRQMLPDLLQLIQLDNWGGIITIAVLYMVVTFGIFSNILMMLQERLHEFGVLMAIGMRKALLIRVVTLEVLMISAFGTLTGAVLGAPIIAYFHYNPIRVSGSMIKAYKQFGIEPVMPFSMKGTIFLWQTLVVFGITLILALYPYFRLRHLKTIEALGT